MVDCGNAGKQQRQGNFWASLKEQGQQILIAKPAINSWPLANHWSTWLNDVKKGIKKFLKVTHVQKQGEYPRWGGRIRETLLAQINHELAFLKCLE